MITATTSDQHDRITLTLSYERAQYLLDQLGDITVESCHSDVHAETTYITHQVLKSALKGKEHSS